MATSDIGIDRPLPANLDAERFVLGGIMSDESASPPPRKPLLVPGSSIETQNPSWTTLLRSILGQVSTELGVEASGMEIVVKLSALILYDSGTEFITSTMQV